MKKILNFTWLNNNNYGTILQAYALQHFLIKEGYDVKNLDYIPNTKNRIYNMIKSGNSPTIFINRFKNKILEKKEYKEQNKIQANKFQEFKKNMIKTTKIYTTEKSLNNFEEKYDAYVCGSDQIWSPKLLNPVYYFSFLPDSAKKIAYAPSFGVSTVKNRKGKKIKKYLASFNSISVREESGSKILYNLTNKKYPVNVDPTLLLTKEEWEKLINKNEIKDQNYIFCYFLKYNDNYYKQIISMASKINKKIIIVNKNFKGETNNKDIIIKNDLGPTEWLSYIKNSSQIFTDSYHGFIFSIIFNKEVGIFKRFADNNSNSQNSRIYNLANKLDLTNRIYDETKQLNIEKKINYDIINQKLNIEVEKSKKWLINAIEK